MNYGFPQAYLFRLVSEETQAAKKAKGICKHHGCSKKARHNRTDCNVCHTRKTRLKNPVMYAFNMLKRSADKRLIPFNLTFEQFCEFNNKTGYVEKMGRDSDSLTVDRIDSSKGYEVGNIRALTYLDNVSKKLEGMEQPCDPIAKLIHGYSGSKKNWRAFRPQASEVLDLVERLQKYTPHDPVQEDDDSCPF